MHLLHSPSSVCVYRYTIQLYDTFDGNGASFATRYPLRFMPDDVILMSVICPVEVASCSVGRYEALVGALVWYTVDGTVQAVVSQMVRTECYS